jgi:hypothetical protein
MEVTQFLSLALSSLVVIVVLHFVVFWVVKTMYPPQPVAPLPIQVMPVPPPPPPPAFTEPPPIKENVDRVTIPTYETPLPVEADGKEEPRRGPPPPEETSIRRKAGMDTPNA